MPTVFIHSHHELINLSHACRTEAAKQRQYASAQNSIAVKHTHLKSAAYFEALAKRFAEAARLQERMWKVHRGGSPK